LGGIPVLLGRETLRESSSVILVDNSEHLMKTRAYYSRRTGKNQDIARLDLAMLCRLFRELYVSYVDKGYFQEAFGYYCVDDGDIPGTLGSDIEAQMFLQIRKPGLSPIHEQCLLYQEEDLFDVIEFTFDCVSKPEDGVYHAFSNCGWHYETFDQTIGQSEYRADLNVLLSDYEDGYELSAQGEILALAEPGLQSLLEADVPACDAENVESRINAAILKFRRYRSSLEDRRDALRDLADVLEFIRPQAKQVLVSKDEDDLFNIANNFGIRHHNDRQKTDYDKPIWYSWIFYYYLATIHATLRLIEKSKPTDDEVDSANATNLLQ
jgi:hypothetical protein